MKSINLQKSLTLVFSLLFSTAFFSGCSSADFPFLYRIDVRQGNIVDDDKLAELKVGMTKPQVKYLLGTALTKDTFTPNRWDYFFSFRTGDGLYERRLLTLMFEQDTLASIEKAAPEEMQLKHW